jgi:UDP-galactopyranose mutase
MLAHPNIHLLLKTESREAIAGVRFDRMIFTGPIDEYFDYCHGPLPYRSLRFEMRHERDASFQDVAVVNYPNEHSFTRVIEFKHFSGQQSPGTTIAYEYPEAHEPGQNVPYYPVPKIEHRDQYERYLREAQQRAEKVIFAGRLADYKYYNMDQAVGRALHVFANNICNTNCAMAAAT